MYYTEDYKGFVQNHRGSLNSLAEGLLDEGDTTRASNVLLFNLAKIPDNTIPYDLTSVTTADMLYKVGQKQKGLEIANVMGPRAIEMANYDVAKYSNVTLEIRRDLYILGELQRILYENGDTENAKKYEDAYQSIIQSLQIRGAMGRMNIRYWASGIGALDIFTSKFGYTPNARCPSGFRTLINYLPTIKKRSAPPHHYR
ncbi:MAG: hypothetical protein WDN75_03255 [Bacteroidota bacterium]